MKRRIVLLKNMEMNFESAVVINTKDDESYYDGSSEYVFLSEIVEVDFPELDSKTVLSKEVGVIEKQMTKVRADAEAAITALDRRKQELLSICHDGRVAADNQ